MSEHAMSRDAMLAALRDIRLPPDAVGGVIAESAAAIGIAASLAALVLFCIRLIGTEQATKTVKPATHDLSTIVKLAEPGRRLALLRYLKTRDPDRFAAITAENALYHPDGVSTETIEAEVRRSA